MVVIFSKASASASRINQVLACEPSITDTASAPVALPACALEAAAVSALRFDHVGFRYGSASADALDDATICSCPLAERWASSRYAGSGKSTLVSLLPRLYDVARGGVEVTARTCALCAAPATRRYRHGAPDGAAGLGTVRSNLCAGAKRMRMIASSGAPSRLPSGRFLFVRLEAAWMPR